MKFDAYAGNISGSKPEEVATMVSWAFKGRVERGRPRGRYHDVFELFDVNEGVGWVAHDAQLDTAYFEFKGARTPDTSAAVRKHWPTKHQVSRADSAEDYNDPAAFDQLVGVMDAAADPRVISDMIAPRNGDRGRTFYWGAVTSRMRARVYEAGKMKDRLHFCTPNWVRAEAQVRPGKSAEKLLAATLSPLELWGFSAWSKRAAEQLTHVEVPRFAPVNVPPTFDRTTLYLARAYRRHFEQMLEDLGDGECVMRELRAVWVADDEARGLGPA